MDGQHVWPRREGVERPGSVQHQQQQATKANQQLAAEQLCGSRQQQQQQQQLPESFSNRNHHTIGDRAHKLFQHKLFAPPPPPKTPHFGPPVQKVMCLISWERTQKGTHINFFGEFLGSKRGSQTGRFRPQKV